MPRITADEQKYIGAGLAGWSDERLDRLVVQQEKAATRRTRELVPGDLVRTHPHQGWRLGMAVAIQAEETWPYRPGCNVLWEDTGNESWASREALIAED